jgi:hypothetical protein
MPTIARPEISKPAEPARAWPSRIVRLASLALPRSAIRDRYRQEFIAELYGLPGRQQTRHAISILTHSLALRQALASPRTPTTMEATTMPRSGKPFLCRTNLHHTWELAHTPDGQRFVRCARCHKERDSGPAITGPGAASTMSTPSGG